MQSIFLTDKLTSAEDLNMAFESIFNDSKLDCQTSHSSFRSEAEGILTGKFFLGHQKLRDLDVIKISNFDHCAIPIPKEGHFSTSTRNRTVVNSSGDSGTIVFPACRAGCL